MPEDLSTWRMPERVMIEPEPSVRDDAQAVQPERRASSSELVYHYTPGREYVVLVPLGWPMDIQLQPGEILHTIVGGDRAPLQEGDAPLWEVKEGLSNTEGTPIVHVLITPSHIKKRIGLVITTTRRSYHLTCVSVSRTLHRMVRWTYDPPQDAQKRAVRPTIFPDPAHSKRYHIGYDIAGEQNTGDWMPTQVVDDGRSTYIIFPFTMLYQAAPLLRLIGPSGPQMVNSRQVSNVYIVDQLISRAELRVGAGEHAQIATITRGNLETIQCPGHDLCPHFPQH